VVRFARVGLLSTFAYAVLFLILRLPIGNYWGNALALGICTVANVMAHRWLALRDDPSKRGGLLLGGVASLTLSLAVTTAALLLASWLGGTGWGVSLVAVLIASAGAAFVRFSVLSTLVFRAGVKKTNRSNEIEQD
jgi:putative flippase GtrA